MKRIVPGMALAVMLAFIACSAPGTTPLQASSNQVSGQSPFLVSVVPTRSFGEPVGRVIAMAKKSPGFFYVVVTNASKAPQEVFESWNSWGYQAVSFEVQTADGRRIAISKKPQGFTRNFPSTFVIPPGEHVVYAISLDNEWDAVPSLPMADETPIKISIKAIYEIKPTPEAARANVWTGRQESKIYDFNLRHW